MGTKIQRGLLKRWDNFFLFINLAKSHGTCNSPPSRLRRPLRAGYFQTLSRPLLVYLEQVRKQRLQTLRRARNWLFRWQKRCVMTSVGKVTSALLTTIQQEEEDKKVTRMKEMELRRQQIAEKKAELERARQVEEEQKARLEAEKRREREEGASKKLPTKPPTTIKKVSRVGSPSSQTCFQPVHSDIRLPGILRTSERQTETVQLLDHSRHRRQNLPVSNKPSPSQL